jgi:hypothetical protein
MSRGHQQRRGRGGDAADYSASIRSTRGQRTAVEQQRNAGIAIGGDRI